MKNAISIWDKKIIKQALSGSVRKLDPRKMLKNPVMFVVEVGASFLTVRLIVSIIVGANAGHLFEIQITLWLWFTVLFANFAEAMAEGRGKAQADTLRRSKTESAANIIRADGTTETIAATALRKDDVVMVIAGESIPGDGEVIEGVASVDESAITGESAPV
ncbi:MAG TPA: potassium-transporting ATPase subunit B, partial [Pyrinomonadaceae bacterium]|nr:potassium-transporting ATPase subunit B [Pyrinomonadaceae bacterium]